MSIVTLDDGVREKLLQLTDSGMNPCYQCGTCTATCPVGLSVRKFIRAAQLGVRGGAEGILYCTTCKFCEERCPRGVEIMRVIHGLRVLGFEGRKAPSKLEQALWGVYEDGNPWGGRKPERGKWAEGLGVKDALKGVKTLLYVGCASSFDPRLQKVALSMVEILKAADVDFGILGKEEKCCGDVVYHVGEEGFLEELIQENIATFKKTGAETVVALSPHCSNIFKTLYPRYGGDFQALHYTEMLAQLVDEGKISFNGRMDAPLTYHDPCYLGRYHGVYETPRKVLEAIPGVKLAEMRDTKENALCCGGGGGVMWLEVPGERLAHKRVLQAADTGAEVFTTSCPYCIQNFEDGVKTKGVKGLRVADVAEMAAQALNSRP